MTFPKHQNSALPARNSQKIPTLSATHSETVIHPTTFFSDFPVSAGIFPAFLLFFRQTRSRWSAPNPLVLRQKLAKDARNEKFWQNPLQVLGAYFSCLLDPEFGMIFFNSAMVLPTRFFGSGDIEITTLVPDVSFA